MRVLCFFLCALVSFSLNAGVNYRLGVGDILSINVFGEPDLSFEEVLVPSSGFISYPLLGDVKAKGYSIKELHDSLELRLKDGYLINPKISISIVSYRGFFIDGEVRQPGLYPYQPNLTVRMAISIGGGLTGRASSDSISLIREVSQDRLAVDVELHDKVNPGDILTIGESFF